MTLTFAHVRTFCSGDSVPFPIFKCSRYGLRIPFLIQAQYILKIYALHMQSIMHMHSLLSVFSASSSQIMGNCRVGEYVLHLFTVCRTFMNIPLWICHEQCVCVASNLRTMNFENYTQKSTNWTCWFSLWKGNFIRAKRKIIRKW